MRAIVKVISTFVLLIGLAMVGVAGYGYYLSQNPTLNDLGGSTITSNDGIVDQLTAKGVELVSQFESKFGINLGFDGGNKEKAAGSGLDSLKARQKNEAAGRNADGSIKF